MGSVSVLLALALTQTASSSRPTATATISTATATTVVTRTVEHINETEVATESATIAEADDLRAYRVAPDEPGGFGNGLLQSVLFIPRVVTKVIFWPIGSLIYLLEKYEIAELFTDTFFNDARTFGLYPTAFVETGFGLNVGARMVVQDLFDHDAGISLRAGYGGRFRQSYEGTLTTGTLISRHVRVEGFGRYEDLPNEFYFGVGVNPSEERIRVQRRRTGAGLTLLVTPDDRIEFAVAGLYGRSRVSNSDENPNANLDEFRPVLNLFYEEFRATWDSRRSDPLIAAATPSRGTYVSGTFGFTQAVSAPATQYYRYSADARTLFDLGYGTRVLTLRLYTEGVFGADNIPVVELPRLGGPSLLRGYRRDRFRDQNVLLASVEYRYPLSGHAAAYFFVDGGRVFEAWDEIGINDWGLGFGGGLQFHGSQSVFTRIQLAASRQGDFVFNLVLNPEFEQEPRSER